MLVIWDNFNNMATQLIPWVCQGRGSTVRFRLGSVSSTLYFHSVLTPDQTSGGAVLLWSCSLKLPQTKCLWSLRRVWGLVLTDFCAQTVCDKASGPEHLSGCLLLEFAPSNTIILVYMCALLDGLLTESLETSCLSWR